MNHSKKARNIKPSTEKKLFALSKNQCYKPNCSNKLITDDKRDVLAKIAHIEAASPNGPRFNSNMTDDERRDFDNLILLCDEHHIEIDSHANEFPTELLKEWKILHEGTDTDALFQSMLKEKYLDEFNIISLLSINTPKPIDEIFINLTLMEDVEKDIKTAISHESFLERDDFMYDEDDFMDISELTNKSSKSLIYGTAGIGKTTLCKYISYMWAKGELYQEFDFVIYIALREWKYGGIKGAIKDYYFSLDESVTFEFEDSRNKTLFLFDGYDELKEEKKKDLKNELKKQKLSNYIVTSRPYGYEKSDFPDIKQHFETVGFTPNNVAKYIENFFKDEKEEQSLKSFLEANINIKVLSYIPLMLEMICIVWREENNSVTEDKNFSMSMTKLYQKVVEYLLKDHAENREDKSVYKTRHRKKIEKHFSQVAFEGLKSQRILFDYEFLEKIFVEDSEIDFFEDNVINSGFLKSDLSDKSLLDNNFEFLHLTFQEYFSALYVSKLDEKKQRDIISEYKFYPHFQVFFVFLAGLIENKTLLIEEIGNEPKDIMGLYEILFIMNVLTEIKVEELEKSTLHQIKEKLKKQIKITCKNDYYEVVFGNFNKILHIIDDEIINILLDIIELGEDEFLEQEIVDTFNSLIKYDLKYKKLLEKIVLVSRSKDIKRHIYKLFNKNKKTKKEIELDLILNDLYRLSNKISSISTHVYDTLYSILKDKKRNVEIESSIVKTLQKYNIENHLKWVKNNFDKIEEDGRLLYVDAIEGKKIFQLRLQDSFLDKKRQDDILTILNIMNHNIMSPEKQTT